jgi:hypothetical protein
MVVRLSLSVVVVEGERERLSHTPIIMANQVFIGDSGEFFFLTANLRRFKITDEYVEQSRYILIPIVQALLSRWRLRHPWIIEAFVYFVVYVTACDTSISKVMRRHQKYIDLGLKMLADFFHKERIYDDKKSKLFYRQMNLIIHDEVNILNLSHAFSAMEAILKSGNGDEILPYVPQRVEYDFRVLRKDVATFLHRQIEGKFWLRYTGKHASKVLLLPLEEAKEEVTQQEEVNAKITATCLLVMMLRAADSNACLTCLKTEGGRAVTCQTCRVVHYCSEECRVNDKMRHIAECMRFKVTTDSQYPRPSSFKG